MTHDQACQTPLVELLEGVPADAHMTYEHSSTHHQMIPVGRLCHEAADQLKALKPMIAERERLREACGDALGMMNEPIITPKIFNEVGCKLQAVLALTQSGEGSLDDLTN